MEIKPANSLSFDSIFLEDPNPIVHPTDDDSAGEGTTIEPITEFDRKKATLRTRIARVGLASLAFLAGCTQIKGSQESTQNIDLTQQYTQQVNPTFVSTTDEEDTTVLPSYTPTKELEATPTFTNTPTMERPTKTLIPTETPTPRPTVELPIPPGEIGKNYFYFIDKPYVESGLSGFFFCSGEIMNVEVDGEDVVLSIRTFMRGNEVVLKSRTKGFNLINTKLDENEEGFMNFISTKNIKDIPIGIEIYPMYVYTRDRMSPQYRQGMLNTCNSTEKDPSIVSVRNSRMPFCANMDSLYGKGIGTLSEDALANWFEGKDMSNIDFDLALLMEVYYEE